jgi:hypothetical protein
MKKVSKMWSRVNSLESGRWPKRNMHGRGRHDGEPQQHATSGLAGLDWDESLRLRFNMLQTANFLVS